MAIKADPNFRMLPEWEQINQEVAEKIARQEAVKEAITEKVKNSKDIKDDSRVIDDPSTLGWERRS